MLGQRTGVTCIRNTLCLLNAFTWLLGCAVLGAGAWLRTAYGGHASLLQGYGVLSADSLCLAAGVAAFLLSFCACCGSWCLSRCLLVLYFCLLVGVVALEVAAGAVLYTHRVRVGDAVAGELRAGLRAAGNLSDEDPVAASWHRLHVAFQCCGVAGPSDWHDSPAWPGKPWVPHSCCRPPHSDDLECGRQGAGGQALGPPSPAGEAVPLHQTGCYDAVRLWLAQRLHLLGLGALVIAFLQLFGLVSSVLLLCTLGEKRKSRTYKSYASDPT